MTPAVALLLGAALVAWLAPHRLRTLTAAGVHPRVVLVAWLSSVVSVVVTTALAVTVLLLPDHGSNAFAAVHHCLTSLLHGSSPRVETVSGAVGSLLLMGLVVRLGVVSVRGARRRVRTRREHLAVLRIPAVVRELVELAADASAVRTCGVDAVRGALLTVTGFGTPGSALAMSRDAVEALLAVGGLPAVAVVACP
jgi:hypothetical protein